MSLSRHFSLGAGNDPASFADTMDDTTSFGENSFGENSFTDTDWLPAPPSFASFTDGTGATGTGGATGGGGSTASVPATQTVTYAGSGLVFVNDYGAGVTATFQNEIVAAENFYQSHYTNAVTLTCSFNVASLNPAYSGENSFSPVGVSYSQLRSALASHATSADQLAAAAALANLADPSGGRGFEISVGEARILGLAGPGTGAVDDSVVLNSYYWTASALQNDPNDAIDVVEHEISEGAMGRIGSLGVDYYWAPMDLFRYTASGQRDFTGGSDGVPTYFSPNGQNVNTGLQYHNSINSSGQFDGFDLADWDGVGADATDSDPFGPGGPGAGGSGVLSATDLEIMDVLGWTRTNLPTLSVTSDFSATRGQGLNLSTLVTILDPQNVGYTQLELWDTNGTAAGGQFVVNNQAQTGGHEIDVLPAYVAGTLYDVGTAGGTDTLWARLLQNNGQLTGWEEFTVTAPTAQPPTLSVTSDSSATRGQQLNLSTLVTILDPQNVGYTQLELWDTNGTAAGGQFVVNNQAQTGGHEIDVLPAYVAGTLYDVGTAGGTDTLWARLLQNNGQLTSWEEFTVTAPRAQPPTLSVTSDSSATRGQQLNLSTLVTILDPQNVGYTQLELWDTNGTASGGQFVVNNQAQTGGHEIDVLPAFVAGTLYDVGTAGGTDTLWARLLQNNGQLTSWEEFTVTVPLPSLTVNNVANATPGQVLSLSSFLTIAEPGNVGYTQLELWDSNGTAAGGQFNVNGTLETGGQEIDVTPANVANTFFDVGTTAGGTDTLWARLLQNNGQLTSWEEFTVTASSGAAQQMATLAPLSTGIGGTSPTVASGVLTTQDIILGQPHHT
jgi:hypothetical protein